MCISSACGDWKCWQQHFRPVKERWLLIFPSLLKEIAGTTPFFVAHPFVKKYIFLKKMLYKFKYLFGWLISNNNNKTFIIAVGCCYLEICYFFSRIKYSPAFLTDNKDVKLVSAFHISSPGCSTGGWMDGWKWIQWR